MNTDVVNLRGVRKPSLILIKGGRGKVAPPPLTDDERYLRFPPAWVDWLVLGLGLATLNLPSPVPLVSIVGIVLIALLVARRIKKEGGEDPNIDDGVATFLAEFFTDSRVKRPLERRLPAVTAFTKQIIVFAVCEVSLYFLWQGFSSGSNDETSSFLTILLFVVVTCAGLQVLIWWDTPTLNHKKL